MNTQSIGEIGCLMFDKQALEFGFISSKPCIDARYDRILDCNGFLYRVQIKTCSKSKRDGYSIGLRTVYYNGKKTSFYSKTEIDVLVIFIVDKNILLWIDDFENKKSFRFSVKEARNNQKKRIKKLEDYIWRPKIL